MAAPEVSADTRALLTMAARRGCGNRNLVRSSAMSVPGVTLIGGALAQVAQCDRNGKAVTVMDDCKCERSFLTRAEAGVLTCGQCGGQWTRANGKPYVLPAEAVGQMAAFLAAGGLAVLVPALDDVAYIDPSQVIRAPGWAHLSRCGDCDYETAHGRVCECGGTGIRVYRACVACGDSGAWSYADESGAQMRCACGATWDAAHPGWIAQRVPDRLLAVAS